MSRTSGDEADDWLEAWAYQWTQMFIKDPKVAREYLGPLCCTLGRVGMYQDGAGASTERDRPIPEGFLGNGLVVAVAIQHMNETGRDILKHNYVVRFYNLDTGAKYRYPIRMQRMAVRMGIDIGRYSRRLDKAKNLIRDAFGVPQKKLDDAPRKTYVSASVGYLPR